MGGCSLNGGVLTLLDHNGNGLAGGKAAWADGTWHPIPGQTDANGKLFFSVTNPNYNTIRMDFHQGGVEQNRTQLDASSYTWQTVRARIRLLQDDCVTLISDNPGGMVDQGGGYWENVGNTGPNGGYVDWEVFGGQSFKFRMIYHGASQEGWYSIPLAGGNVDYCTARVTLWFTGNIEMNFGTWGNYYTRPMYLLPVNHPLYFSNGTHGRKGPYNLNPTAGTQVEKTFAYVSVKKSNGQGQSGVTPTRWWDYGGPTTTINDPTDGNGALLIAMDGKHTNTNVQISYLDAHSDDKWQNPATGNSFYDYQLVKATVRLIDNEGNLITAAAPDVYAHYYGGGEFLFGTMSGGSVSRDLLPKNPNVYFFDIKSYSFNGSQGTVTKKITATTTVDFQTGKVVDGGFGCTQYWQYGGLPQAFSDGVQLLPGNYFFKNGATTKNLTVKAGQTLDINAGTYTAP